MLAGEAEETLPHKLYKEEYTLVFDKILCSEIFLVLSGSITCYLVFTNTEQLSFTIVAKFSCPLSELLTSNQPD